jgi:hypothetical protein
MPSNFWTFTMSNSAAIAGRSQTSSRALARLGREHNEVLWQRALRARARWICGRLETACYVWAIGPSCLLRRRVGPAAGYSGRLSPCPGNGLWEHAKPKDAQSRSLDRLLGRAALAAIAMVLRVIIERFISSKVGDCVSRSPLKINSCSHESC